MLRQPKETSAYHHGNLREQLVVRGLAIVEQDGLDALTMRRLATAAGVSRSAAYHHFRNKDQLLEAIVVFRMGDFVDDMRSALLQPANCDETFVRLCGLYVEAAMTHSELFQLMTMRWSSPNSSIGAPIDIALKLVTEFIARQYPLASIASIRSSTYCAWGAAHGLALLLLGGPLSVERNDSQARSLLVCNVAQMVEAGITAKLS